MALISDMQIQLKWKNKLFELFCGPVLNYDRNDDNHDYKNNSHDNFNNDSKASEIKQKQKDKETSLKCWRFISNANYQLCI